MMTDKFPWYSDNDVGGKTNDWSHYFGQGDLLDLAGIGLWLFDACGDTIYVNDAIAERLGYSREEMLTLPMVTFTGKEGLAEARQPVRSQQPKTVEKYEARFFHRNGSEIWVKVSSIPSYDAAGICLGTAWVLVDITESKRLHQEMVRENDLLNAIVNSAEDIIYVKDREERYRAILENIQDGYFECSLDGKVTFCNDAFCRIHGLNPQTVHTVDFRELMKPETSERISQALHQIYLSGDPLTSFEAEFLNPDGTSRFVDNSISLIRDEKGNAIGFRGIMRDTTERRLAEEARRESVEKFRVMANEAPAMIWLSGPDKLATFLNQRWLEFTGRLMQEELGDGWMKCVHPDDFDRISTIYNAAHSAREPFTLEYRGLRHDGVYRWIMDSGTPRFAPDGEFLGYIGSCFDITDRKEAEEALGQGEERYRTILENIHDGYYEVDFAGRLTFVNDGLVRMFGLGSDGTLLGANMLKFADEKHAYRLRKMANWVYRSGNSVSSFVYELRQSNGTRRDVDISLSLIKNHGGEATGFRGIIRDVTERKRVEDSLRASEERFAKAFSASPQPMSMVALTDGRFLYVNDAWVKSVGMKREEVIGRTVPELNLQRYPMPRDQFVELLRQKGHLYDLEVRTKKADGQMRIQLFSFELLELDGQEVTLSISQDITDRKLAEDALRASEERFVKAFHASPQPMSIIELPSRMYTNVNEALLRSSGYTAEEMIGRTSSELGVWVNSDDSQRASELLARHGFIRNMETCFRTKEGEIRDFLYSAEQIVFDRKPHLLVVANDITERKRAEEGLRQNEALLRSVIESNPDWIFVKDLDHRYKLVNQTYANSLHLQAEDFIGKDELELGFPEEQVKGNPERGIRGFWNDDQEVFDLGRAKFIEQEPVEVDGQTRFFNTFKVPLFDDDGNVWGVLGVGRDVTGLRQAEAALRLSEERFAKAFDASPQPMVIFEASDRRIINVNEAMVRTFGWSMDEMIGHTPEDLNIWVDLEQQNRVRTLLGLQGFVRDLEIKFRTKSGEIREFLYSAETMKLENRLHFLVLASDITERLRAERALQESEERHRLLFEHGFAGISRSTMNGRMLECNDALARIFGCESREELLQRYATDFYFDQSERQLLVDDLKKYGHLKNYERLMKRKDGSPVWTLANFSLHQRGQNGEMVWDSIVLDITQRKLIEQQLAQTNAEIRALSTRLETIREEERTRISREIHDNLGQALTGLKLEFSWLDKNLTRATDENLRRKAIPKLKEISHLLEETIQTVRHIATELRPGVLDTLGLSAAIDWQAREFARRSGIQCEIQLCNEPQGLPAERATALFRIFQEILTNIARHSHARQFKVKMAENNGDLVLTVRDNGVGITEEQLRNPKSLGLIGMRERVLIFGGTLVIEGHCEGRMAGTIVNVKMPATR